MVAAYASLGFLLAAGTHATTLSRTPPTQRDVERLAQLAARRPFNYAPVGMTRGAAAPAGGEGWRRRVELDALLGSGRPTFRRAARALRELRVHEGSRTRGIGVAAARGRHSSLVGSSCGMVTWARSALGVYAINPCRIVADDASRTRVAVTYGTVQGHWIAGEESMVVRYEPRSGRVTFSVRSLSRGSGALGGALFPFLGRMQRAFFEEQVSVMQRLSVG